eukprot:359006-Prorocentrum_minimum.AAC.1
MNSFYKTSLCVAPPTQWKNQTAPPAAMDPAMDPRFYVMSVDLALWVADPPVPLAPVRHAPDEVRQVAFESVKP